MTVRRAASYPLLALVLAACNAAPTPEADPAEVETVVASFYEDIGAADYPGMEALTTPDFEIVDGGLRMDFREFRDFLADVFAQGVELDFALDRLNTVVQGDVAYTTLRALNQPLDRAFHETVILRRIDGVWLVDRFHSTPVRE
ncbi:MAG TPA: nuclear transport factor 2 family protein [Longimicrobiales bacterium]|nr:nuclear transport factor 2 family protein [Longimicrobiales bacterium]